MGTAGTRGWCLQPRSVTRERAIRSCNRIGSWPPVRSSGCVSASPRLRRMSPGAQRQAAATKNETKERPEAFQIKSTVVPAPTRDTVSHPRLRGHNAPQRMRARRLAREA
jgi:hypothetical protein